MPRRSRDVGSPTEASGCLVAPAVFKTDVVEYLDQAGSIPVRLRHLLLTPKMRSVRDLGRGLHQDRGPFCSHLPSVPHRKFVDSIG